MDFCVNTSECTKTDKTSRGTHVILDLYEIKKDKFIPGETLIDVLTEILTRNHATIIKKDFHNFPQVCEESSTSLTFLLAESHLAIHTWPEYGYVSLDVYTCGDKVNTMGIAKDIIDWYETDQFNGKLIYRSMKQ